MSKANPTTGERMTKIETKISSIEKQNNVQSKILNKIEDKLDGVIENKADKSEVAVLRSKVNNTVWQVTSAVMLLLLGVVGFLIRYTLF